MTPYHQIRANYDKESIVVYQAYRDAIAKPALRQGKFVEPFSWGRMTWIKPSFLWMMGRSNWAEKKGQENILAIRMKRSGFEHALSQAVLTSLHRRIHGDAAKWRAKFKNAIVHVQWDPERTLHGKKLEHRSIQIGLSRNIIREYTDDWILEINEATPLVKKIRSAYLAGNHRKAKELLPKERVYTIEDQTTNRNLGIAEQSK